MRGDGENGSEAMTEEEKRKEFVYQVLVGHEVVVTCVDGKQYRGVLHAIDEKEIVLRVVSIVHDGAEEIKFARPEGRKSIPDAAWCMLEALEVKVGAADVGAYGAQDDAGGFGTDAAISRGKGGLEGRQLERWTPEPGEMEMGGLEDMGGSHRGWDQFALNESQFGVKSDYHEELYTTALDPKKSKISMKEAARIAAEIEKNTSSGGVTNVHVLEERGMEVDGLDEEERYGAVIRDSVVDSGQKKTIRPSARSASIQIDPRKETNKVRAHMTGSKTSSPYGTPKLDSPLISDVKKFEALNLDPGVAKVDEETLKDFQAFKAKQAGKESGMKQGLLGSALEKAAKQAENGEEKAQKKSFSLNPNAKSFEFNVNAKEFNPTSFSKPSPEPQESRSRKYDESYHEQGAPPPPPPPERMPTGGYPMSSGHMHGMMPAQMVMMPGSSPYFMMGPRPAAGGNMYGGGYNPAAPVVIPMMGTPPMMPGSGYGDLGGYYDGRSPNSAPRNRGQKPRGRGNGNNQE